MDNIFTEELDASEMNRRLLETAPCGLHWRMFKCFGVFFSAVFIYGGALILIILDWLSANDKTIQISRSTVTSAIIIMVVASLIFLVTIIKLNSKYKNDLSFTPDHPVYLFFIDLLKKCGRNHLRHQIELADNYFTMRFGEHHQTIPYKYIRGFTLTKNYLVICDYRYHVTVFKCPSAVFLQTFQNKVTESRINQPTRQP